MMNFRKVLIGWLFLVLLITTTQGQTLEDEPKNNVLSNIMGVSDKVTLSENKWKTVIQHGQAPIKMIQALSLKYIPLKISCDGDFIYSYVDRQYGEVMRWTGMKKRQCPHITYMPGYLTEYLMVAPAKTTKKDVTVEIEEKVVLRKLKILSKELKPIEKGWQIEITPNHEPVELLKNGKHTQTLRLVYDGDFMLSPLVKGLGKEWWQMSVADSPYYLVLGYKFVYKVASASAKNVTLKILYDEKK